MIEAKDRRTVVSELEKLILKKMQPYDDGFVPVTLAPDILEWLDSIGYWNMHFYGVATPDIKGEEA